MEEIKILNLEQVKFYLSKNVQPLRIELGRKNKIVYVYSKADTYELFGQWLEISANQRRLKQEYRNNFN